MTGHELAAKLLALPDLPVQYIDSELGHSEIEDVCVATWADSSYIQVLIDWS